jgi:hypothetical protein
MKCLKCEKELKFLENSSSNIDDGGDLNVSFHYGSRHDMCLGFSGRKMIHKDGEDRRARLLSCDHIQAYICDDCFEQHIELFDGYDNPEEPRKGWVKVVG